MGMSKESGATSKIKDITDSLQWNTTELTDSMKEQAKEDLKPIIFCLGLALCMCLSALGTSHGINKSSSALAAQLHKKGVTVFIFILGGFTFIPFLLSMIIVIMKLQGV